jgi:predicted Zn-dependent protease
MTSPTAADDLILGLTKVVDLPGLSAAAGTPLGAADIEALLREAERFCAERIAPGWQEADRQGMRLMRDAAVDPRGMVAAFEMLDAEGGGLQGALAYLSTHPRTADRIAILKRLAAKPMKPVVPLKLATTWKRVISKCGY